MTDLPPRPAGARPPGRPLSSELSDQLVAVAMDILADEGWGRLNSDRVAARAKAGKAGIYRRWPTMAALARHALSTTSLVELPADAGSLSADLCGLLVRWTQPLDRSERAAASLVGAARHDDDLRAGLDEALLRPLGTAVREIAAREAARGHELPAARVALLGSVLEALWWQRYAAAAAAPRSSAEVEHLVTDVLVPIVEPEHVAEPERVATAG
ncbi:TetR family transcriptional regulator [Modestobacter muralis]|uniref:TetR family transcriptional regulator n=1 Tax=Modestobacter muralis TaxID=1608614 RepID=A0A6P0EXK1_9ACTN|nr:TetR-like C-terminal domain-containing protein [Modestobacter muralis]NEK96422.1 TetR family transcriptional regulator [Modestobacter muralis]NEN53322.1 TetR family transcriptional regulator [Modestobacter muralis]